MLFLFGAIMVTACVLGGYVMHGGKLEVLWQPTEFIIICGAAIGSFLITNPWKDVVHVLKSFKLLFAGKTYKRPNYIELLTLQFIVFKTMKSKGMLELEQHLENPSASPLFGQYPTFLKHKHAVHFFCDYLRILTMGMDDQYQIEDLMTQDLDAQKAENEHTSLAILTMADAMPALGIVAAVLGVIVTMGSITEPPEILGALIGAALVGTFLGVLLSYGLFAPIGRCIGAYLSYETQYIECIRNGLLAHIKGNAPAVSVEFARNAIPPDVRPAFREVELALDAVTASSAG